MSKKKKTSQKNKKKICHCDDTCGKRLSARSRRRHYKAAVDKANIQPSESESEPVDDDSVSSSPSDSSLSELSSSDDSAMPVDPVELPICDIEIELSDISESDSEESTAMDVDEEEEHDFGGYFDPLEPEDAAGLDDWNGFDEEQDADEPLSRAEMIQQLEEMIMPEDEANLWDIRTLILSSLLSLLTSFNRK